MPVEDGTVELPEAPLVDRLVERVEATGARVWAVGGAVRDALLGLPVADRDFATTALPEVTARAIGEPRDVDPELGRVARRVGGVEVVFTTLREEADYGRDRRPRRVRFVTEPERDALRRDFTVNALYAPPSGGTVLDPTGGLPDLAARQLRVIGDPEERLREDPLRLLRAVRFAGTLGLTLTGDTADAVRATADGVHLLPPGRVRAELEPALTGAFRARVPHVLAELGLWEELVPAVRGRCDPAASAALLDGAGACAAAAWAALLVDVDPRAVAAALAALRLPRPIAREAGALLALTAAVAAGRAPGSEALLAVGEAAFAGLLGWAGARDPELPAELRERRARAERAWSLVAGQDVIAAGLEPGPRVGEVLRRVRESLANHPDADREIALRAVDREVRAVKTLGAEDR